MKNLVIIEETGKRIDAILADREKGLAALEDQISTDDAAIATAKAKMAEATAAEDMKSYKLAKADMEDVKTAKEMHEARRDMLMNKPLITDADYEKTVTAIVSAVAGIESDTKKELCRLSDEMAAVAADLEEVARAANAVLKRLQHDLYHDADRTRNPKTGEVAPLNHEEKHVDPWSTINWGRQGVKCAQYEIFVGRRRD